MIVARRPSFQLISLFDLLIIVIFAQYLDVQDNSARLAQESDRHLTEAHAERDAALLRAEETAAALLRSEKRLDSTSDELEAAKIHAAAASTGFDAAAQFVSRWVGAEQGSLVKRLAATNDKDREAIVRQLKDLVQGGSPSAARHVLTWSEMEKRVDLWQLHITEQGLIRVLAESHSDQLRAETIDRFEDELVRILRTLPDTKPLVLLLLSWDDVDLKTRNQAVRGLERATQRLRDETDRRSRFELGILGYLPSSSPKP